MKPLPNSSFFLFFIVSLMLIACEYKKDVLTHKADTALERLDSITKEKNAQRQYDSALYYGHEEFKLAQKKSNIKFSEKALSRIITAHKNNKNYDSVIFYADKLYTFAEQYKDTFYMARARFRKAQSYKAKELYSDAYEAYLDSKELYVAINDSVKVAGKFLELSSLEKKFGDLLASQLLAIEGLDYLQKRKYPITESKLYFNIAVAAKEQGDFITAEKRINQTLDLANRPEAVQKIGLANVINYYNTKANIFKEQKFYEDAIEIYENLLNSNLGKLPVREEARINSNLAHTLFLKDGFSRRSDSLLQYALTVYQKSAYTQGLISINMNLAELYAENNKQKAIYHVNKAIEYATEANIITSLQEALRNKVLIANNVEDMIAYIRLTEEIERKEDKMQSRFANARLDVKNAENDRIKAKNETARKADQVLILSLILLIILVLIFFIYQKIKRRHKIEKVKTVHKTEVRISAKVHDELANDIHNLMARLETSDPEKDNVLDKLDIIYNNARDISKQNQSIETGKTFPEELSNLFRSYESDEVNVIIKKYDTDIWKGISSHIKITIYRVLQELLTNTKKHSNAALVVVSIEKKNKQLYIQYTDNGKGFNEDISKNGLLNAENRIHGIKGTLTFDTELHKGCKFSINVPV